MKLKNIIIFLVILFWGETIMEIQEITSYMREIFIFIKKYAEKCIFN